MNRHDGDGAGPVAGQEVTPRPDVITPGFGGDGQARIPAPSPGEQSGAAAGRGGDEPGEGGEHDGFEQGAQERHPPRRDRGRERLTAVAIAENSFTAEAIRDELQAAGIPAMLRNRDALSVLYGGLPGGFSIEVLVLEGDADRASAVLGVPPPQLPPPQLERQRKRRRWWG